MTQLVVGHANPDFDAYASMVAATRLYPGSQAVFLGSQNANVREFHNLHEGFLEFADVKSLDLGAVERVIMVDTRDADRIGEIGPVARRARVEVIAYDHHPPSEQDLPGLEDRSQDVGATTTILVHELRRRGVEITPLEASVMLLGIHEDTGSLTYPGSTAADADAAAFLMAKGADMEVLNQFLVRALTPVQRELLGDLLESLEVLDVHGQSVAVGLAVVTEYVDSASVVTHHIVEDLGYRVAFAIVSMADRVHVVGRSRIAEVDVAAVLKHLGGGGHAQAASAAMRPKDVKAVREDLTAALEREVRPPLLARDIWSTPVRTVTPDQKMREAGEIMRTWGHGGLPVVAEDGRLAGLVTRKDYDKAARHGLDHAPVTGFMARDVIVVGPETTLPELERLLASEGIGRVPVVVDGAPVGIVTRKDLLRAEHGDAYLDRRLPRARVESSKKFLASFESLLPDSVREIVRGLGELATERGLRAHLVGGFVRDMLLGRVNLDVDIVVEGDGVAFAEEAAAAMGARMRAHRRFATAVLVFDRSLHADITSARTEYYTRPGALPTVERSSLRQDLFRRDFSINAMAACINSDCFGAIADPFGGLRDLERGAVRVLHALSFVEDPTRVLRCARFEVRYGFSLEPSTEQLAREAVRMGMLAEVSGARIREELLDILDEDDPVSTLRRLEKLGALGLLIPEGARPEGALARLAATAAAYDEIADAFSRPVRRRVALVTALAAESERHTAEKWLRWLRFGREYGEAALSAAEQGGGRLRVLQDRRGMRDGRLHALLAGIPQETLLYLWGAGDETARERIVRYVEVVSRVRPEVGGADLIDLGLAPSPAFSAILSQALADRLDGKAVGREAELANLRRIAERVAPAVRRGRRGRRKET